MSHVMIVMKYRLIFVFFCHFIDLEKRNIVMIIKHLEK